MSAKITRNSLSAKGESATSVKDQSRFNSMLIVGNVPNIAAMNVFLRACFIVMSASVVIANGVNKTRRYIFAINTFDSLNP